MLNRRKFLQKSLTLAVGAAVAPVAISNENTSMIYYGEAHRTISRNIARPIEPTYVHAPMAGSFITNEDWLSAGFFPVVKYDCKGVVHCDKIGSIERFSFYE